jgi:hypothetical protein
MDATWPYIGGMETCAGYSLIEFLQILVSSEHLMELHRVWSGQKQREALLFQREV